MDAPGILNVTSQLSVTGDVDDFGAIYVTDELIVGGSVIVEKGAIFSIDGVVITDGFVVKDANTTVDFNAPGGAELIFEDSQTLDDATSVGGFQYELRDAHDRGLA